MLQKRWLNLRRSLKRLRSLRKLQRDLRSPRLRRECVVSATSLVILLVIAPRRDLLMVSFVGEDVVSII